MDALGLLSACTGFDWDEHNGVKIWRKHRVSIWECEQIFFNHPLTVADDERHSERENRFYALGRADSGRMLFVAFTVRRNLVRVISARDMSRQERKVYESHADDEKENPEV